MKTIAIFLVSLCFQKSFGATADVERNRVYDATYPHQLYIQTCGVSELSPKDDRDGGGPYGHSVAYFQGACLDPKVSYPRLKFCEPNSSVTGTGVSVEPGMRNLSWIGIPGKYLFMDGNLDDSSVLDEDLLKKIATQAQTLGIFKNIEYHTESYAREGGVFTREGSKQESPNDPIILMPEDDFATLNIDTHYALKFGRSVFCSRIPVPKRLFEKAMDFYNGLNDKYALKNYPSGIPNPTYRNYRYDLYRNSCTHPVVNVLAAMGIGEPLKVDAIPPEWYFNIAVPALSFADPVLSFNDADKLRSPLFIYRHPLFSKIFNEYNWIPIRQGGVVEYITHKENQVYFLSRNMSTRREDLDLFELIKRPELTDVRQNLIYFQTAYERILSEKMSLKQILQQNEIAFSWKDRKEFPEFYGRYYKYIEAQLADVNSRLSSLK